MRVSLVSREKRASLAANGSPAMRVLRGKHGLHAMTGPGAKRAAIDRKTTAATIARPRSPASGMDPSRAFSTSDSANSYAGV